jgi:N-acetylmuramoyl-L-alanine amidase
MSTPTTRRRWLYRLSVPFALGLVLTFVPLPQMSFMSASVVNRVPLPTLTEVGAAELPELQAALDHQDEDEAASIAQVADASTAATTTVDEHDDELELTPDRVSGTEADVAPFTAIGVLLDEAPTEPVLARIQDADGSWGEWRELAIEMDEGPDAQPGAGPVEGDGSPYGTAPIWVEDAKGYEINLSGADAPSAEVALVRDEVQRTVTDATPVADAAVPPPVGIRSRAEWGARPTQTSVGSTIKLAVVHHSAGSNSYSPAEVPGVLRSIQAFHMDGRGWSDIAYNIVVDKYGGVWEGRGGGLDRPVIGAHAAGFNTNSVGVMVIGDYTQASVGDSVLESISRVIGWKMALHNVDPSTNVEFTSGGSTKYPAGTVLNLPRVVGHQDVGLTSCPGSIEGHLPYLRARSQEWTTWIRATMGPQGSFGGVVPAANGTLTAIGWVVDLDVQGPSEIVLYSGGRTLVALANAPRDDVAALYPDQGPNHGFWVQWGGFSPGWHEVCITAINRGNGQNSDLGCRTAVVPDAQGRSPAADITAVPGPAGGTDVGGWGNNVNGQPATVQLTVDGAWRRTVSGAGFSARLLGLTGGRRQVCAVIDGIRADCEWVGVPGSNPLGRLDGITAGPNMITAAGWAFDPETLDPIVVAMIIDGQWHTTWANRPRGDWAGIYPGYGDVHGFAIGADVAPGTHWTCVAALNAGGGVDTMLGCQNIVVK